MTRPDGTSSREEMSPSRTEGLSSSTAGLASRAGKAIWAVLPQWLVARALVLGTLALARLVVERTHPTTPGVAPRVREGLLGWDAGWYEAIARVGYGPLGHQSLRFFPLFPLMGRALATLPGISAGTALIVIANLAALVGTALLRTLVLRETGDDRLADRSVWLMSLAPPNFVLVMAYAEGPLLVCTVGTFIAIRRGWPAVLANPPGHPNPGSSGGGGPSPAPAVLANPPGHPTPGSSGGGGPRPAPAVLANPPGHPNPGSSGGGGPSPAPAVP